MCSDGMKESGHEEAAEGIKVAIRMRPHAADSHKRVWKLSQEDNSVTETTTTGEPLPKLVNGRNFFTFDKTFDENASTKQLYDFIARGILQSVMNGLNGTIFAYGQTNSGKTHTMQGGGTIKEGSGNGEGIVHMAAQDIFSHISKEPQRVFLIRVSFIEIYNEEVRDLLVSGDGESILTIREDPQRGVFVNATESFVTGYQNLLCALFTGEKKRSFASTNMNERSSRSHTIFRINIESRKRPVTPMDNTGKSSSANEEGKENNYDDDDGAVRISTLNLVDLAGSESCKLSGATGERQKEGAKINQSLLTLSRVVTALGSSKTKHINFRDSKLTRILQPALSGNARMAIICCASPSKKYLHETRSSLQFASRAKLVKTRAKINEVLDDRSLIKKLQRELAFAKRASRSSHTISQFKALEKEAANAKSTAERAEKNLSRLKLHILRGGLLHGFISPLHQRPVTPFSSDDTYCNVAPSSTNPANKLSPNSRKNRQRRMSDSFIHGTKILIDCLDTSNSFRGLGPNISKKSQHEKLDISNEISLQKEAFRSKTSIARSLQDKIDVHKHDMSNADVAELISSRELLEKQRMIDTRAIILAKRDKEDQDAIITEERMVADRDYVRGVQPVRQPQKKALSVSVEALCQAQENENKRLKKQIQELMSNEKNIFQQNMLLLEKNRELQSALDSVNEDKERITLELARVTLHGENHSVSQTAGVPPPSIEITPEIQQSQPPDIRDSFYPTPPTKQPNTPPEVATMRIMELKKELESYGINTKPFLDKKELVIPIDNARSEGKQLVSTSSTTITATSESPPSSAPSASPLSSHSESRKDRVGKAMEECRAMKVRELKTELESYGISTKSFLEKSEFINACAKARVEGSSNSQSSTAPSASSDYGEGCTKYPNFNPSRRSDPKEDGGGSPFGHAAGKAEIPTRNTANEDPLGIFDTDVRDSINTANASSRLSVEGPLSSETSSKIHQSLSHGYSLPSIESDEELAKRLAAEWVTGNVQWWESGNASGQGATNAKNSKSDEDLARELQAEWNTADADGDLNGTANTHSRSSVEAPTKSLTQEQLMNAADGGDPWMKMGPSAPFSGSAPLEVKIGSNEMKQEGELPLGMCYDTTIFTPTLGVMFFQPKELTRSLFLQTDVSLVNSLNERPIVAHIVEGSSAHSAGIELGHCLLKVNGIDVRNPKEASRLIMEGPRPLPLSFYVPDTQLVVAEGAHMVKYDTRETGAPKSAKSWKPKYCVIGGIIAQPWMMNIYQSKSEYDTAVIEARACRPISVRVKQISLQGAHIHNDWQGPHSVVRYDNKLHPWVFIVILPISHNPIKISSPKQGQLKSVHEGIRKVLMVQRKRNDGVGQSINYLQAPAPLVSTSVEHRSDLAKTLLSWKYKVFSTKTRPESDKNDDIIHQVV